MQHPSIMVWLYSLSSTSASCMFSELLWRRESLSSCIFWSWEHPLERPHNKPVFIVYRNLDCCDCQELLKWSESFTLQKKTLLFGSVQLLFVIPIVLCFLGPSLEFGKSHWERFIPSPKAAQQAEPIFFRLALGSMEDCCLVLLWIFGCAKELLGKKQIKWLLWLDLSKLEIVFPEVDELGMTA